MKKKNSSPFFLGFIAMGLWVFILACASTKSGTEPKMANVSPSNSKFSEIWKVYSFSPKVSATAYDSKSGDDTIIWISGMDNEAPPDEPSSF